MGVRVLKSFIVSDVPVASCAFCYSLETIKPSVLLIFLCFITISPIFFVISDML